MIGRQQFLRLLGGAAASLVAPRIALSEDQSGIRTYTYKVAGGCEIQADVLSPGSGHKKPVVIWIHGGALIMGNRQSIPAHLRKMALDSEYAVVSIDYRLAPETKLPAIIEDLRDAHRWVRAKGPQLFGADADRIAVTGGSAGGYLTLMSGFCLNPRPKALVPLSGYGDIVGPWYSRPDPFYLKQPLVSKEAAYAAVSGPPISNSHAGDGKQGQFYLYCRQHGIWPKEVSGHDPDTENAWFDAYCPIRNVTKSYPPTLLIHGTSDTDVPYEQSKMMDAKLTEAGVEHEFITVPGAAHVLNGLDPAERARIDARWVAFIQAHIGRAE